MRDPSIRWVYSFAKDKGFSGHLEGQRTWQVGFMAWVPGFWVQGQRDLVIMEERKWNLQYGLWFRARGLRKEWKNRKCKLICRYLWFMALGLVSGGLDKRVKSEDTLRTLGYGTSDAGVHLPLPHPMVHGKMAVLVQAGSDT